MATNEPMDVGGGEGSSGESGGGGGVGVVDSPSLNRASPLLPPLHSHTPLATKFALYLSQLSVLVYKCLLVLVRSPRALASFVLAPLVTVAIIWIVQSRINATTTAHHGGEDVPLSYQRCRTLDVYGNEDVNHPCVSIYYAPANLSDVESVMAALAARTGLTLGVDIVATASTQDLVTVLAERVGRFDAAITFDNVPAPICWNPPCVDHSEPSPLSALASCPINHALNASYTLWYNTTDNLNNNAPDWIKGQTRNTYSSNLLVPVRYWALQHALNLAITDVMSGYDVPKIKAIMAEEERAREEEEDKKLASPPSVSNSLHVSLWSFLNGRTGTATWSGGSGGGEIFGFSLDNYQNDAVSKWAGSTIISISVLLLTLLIMQLISHEKQARLIGILRIMGLSESNYWLSWLLTFAGLGFIASLLATGLGKISGLAIWVHCAFSIHLFALFLYILSMAALGLLFNSFLNRAVILNVVGFFLFFIAVIVTVFTGNALGNLIYQPGVPNFLQVLFFIFPWFHYSKIWSDTLLNTSLVGLVNKTSQSVTKIQFTYEWSDITRSQRIYVACDYGDEQCCHLEGNENQCFNAPSTSSAMWSMVILTMFYTLFAWYLAQVFGGSLGMNRRFYFIFTAEFWGMETDDDRRVDALRLQQAGLPVTVPIGTDRLANEQYLSLCNQELRTYKLSKSYDKTSALKECTLKMHRDEVFCLLGHNGAGKSTLVNCLTGLLEPTFGNAFMFGHAIQNVHRIQRDMGVCMQDDILFEDLTPRETLFVFAAVRNIPFGLIRDTVARKIAQFHMQSYADKAVRSLSGGMKRRLSLSLATLGDPRIVFLDEPTTGMDPVNRNKIWATIKELKQGRIVVLTTHNMEEADYLGDTVALMSNGRIRAMGSSLFLKNRYGAGYQLQLLVNPAFHTQVQTIVKQLLPGCEIIHSAGHNAVNADSVGKEASGNAGNNESGHGNFTIGLKRKSLQQLPVFFAWMAAEEKRWREAVASELAAKAGDASAPVAAPAADQDKMLREWSLSNSSLEEVFLRLCAAEKNINERLSGSAEEDEAAEAAELEAMAEHNAKCMLCRIRPALGHVTLYSNAGLAVEFEDLICGACSHSEEATKMLGGPEPSAPSPTTGGEDDAPIELRAHVSSCEFAPLLAMPGAAVSTSSVAPKGVNNDLDIAHQEANFHEAWDQMGHAAPTMRQQVRAMFLKNLALFVAEKKSFALKVLLLLALSAVVAWQTTLPGGRCPQGWQKARKDFANDFDNLPCRPADVASKFYQKFQSPAVPFGGANTNTYSSNDRLDYYECQRPQYANVGACGWVPQWLATPNSRTFSAWTQDVLVDDGAGGRVRSGEDLPFADLSLTYAANFYNWYNVLFEFTDQTGPILADTVPLRPPMPWPYIPVPTQAEHKQAESLAAADLPPPQPLRNLRRVGSKRRSSVRSEQDRISVGLYDRHGTVERETLDNLLWANQLEIDHNATTIPSYCANYLQNTNTAMVFYVNTSKAYDEVLTFHARFVVGMGIELRESKPYPLRNGVRVPETSASNFVPQFAYRAYYWDLNTLPQYFLIVFDTNGQRLCYTTNCGNPPDASGMVQMIHGLSSAFLLTRMESLHTNRPDLGRNVTFTSYWDGGDGSTRGNNTCPNPKINTALVAFPAVSFAQNLSQLSITLALGFMVFISLLNFPNTVSHVIYERENQLLHMMRISGMRDLAYWIGLYAFDSLVLVVWFAVVVAFGFGFGSVVFTGTSVGVLILVHLIFIHYVISFSWLVASLFSKRRIALVVCYLLVVLAAFVGVAMDQYLPTTWNIGYLFVPPLAWVRCLSAIIRYNPQTVSDAHGTQLLSSILFMLLEGSAMMLVAVYLNIASYRGYAFCVPHTIKSLFTRSAKPVADLEMDTSFAAAGSQSLLAGRDGEEVEDVDVRVERAKVNKLVASSSSPSEYPAILIHNLRKVFASKVGASGKNKAADFKVAVDKLCLSVNYGECFGLLGPNGAGKSTTLSILTGLLDATSGSAWLGGFNLFNDLSHVFSILGICPQFDTVYDDLTVRDHLLFYARLKGVEPSFERGLVQYIAELTELDGDPLLKPASSLSGGMKRRLSLGVSLIGNPRIWLLDEPSTGLSPETRREIWNIIEKLKHRSRGRTSAGENRGKAIVITTHSMEEADTLCDRIGILADGGFQCIGTSAHLKTRFGEGFKLTLHLQHDFERAGVLALVRDEQVVEARAVGSSASAPAVDLSKHLAVLAAEEEDQSGSSVLLVDAAGSQARARQHCQMLRFITRMAPHAVLCAVDGKHVQFRLVPSGDASSASAPQSVDEHGETKEVLSVFNHMEKHRTALLPSYDVEEWGLAQSSLEEVFLRIVKKYETDDEPALATAAGGAQETKKGK